MTGPGEDISAWAQAIESFAAKNHSRIVKRAVVLAETRSTQDAALELSAAQPGCLVVADRQTAGRGRQGRTWDHAAGRALAATLTMNWDQAAPERISLAAGVAAARAIEEAISAATGGSAPLLGLRWPNDVVEREPVHGPGRKVAGVLIEVRDGLTMLGVGINVGQTEGEFPPHLRGRAASIRMLIEEQQGSFSLSRLVVLLKLIAALDRELSSAPDETLQEWDRRDVLHGTRRTFLYDGRVVTGRVVGIDPLHLITVITDAGERVQLPALSTSLAN